MVTRTNGDWRLVSTAPVMPTSVELLWLDFPVTAGVLQGSYKGGGGNPIFDPQLNSPLFAGGDAFWLS